MYCYLINRSCWMPMKVKQSNSRGKPAKESVSLHVFLFYLLFNIDNSSQIWLEQLSCPFRAWFTFLVYPMCPLGWISYPFGVRYTEYISSYSIYYLFWTSIFLVFCPMCPLGCMSYPFGVRYTEYISSYSIYYLYWTIIFLVFCPMWPLGCISYPFGVWLTGLIWKCLLYFFM